MKIKNFARTLMTFVMLAGLTACSGMPTSDKSSVVPDAKPGSVTYLDTDRFDESLSSLLAKKSPTVTVSFLDPPEVGDMPMRMNTWLAAVEEHGGSLNMEGQQEGSKSASAVLALVALVKEGHSMYKESMKFTPTKNYDAVIKLAEDGVEVKHIDFVLREAE